MGLGPTGTGNEVMTHTILTWKAPLMDRAECKAGDEVGSIARCQGLFPLHPRVNHAGGSKDVGVAVMRHRAAEQEGLRWWNRRDSGDGDQNAGTSFIGGGDC
jgi:hypothetical protein